MSARPPHTNHQSKEWRVHGASGLINRVVDRVGERTFRGAWVAVAVGGSMTGRAEGGCLGSTATTWYDVRIARATGTGGALWLSEVPHADREVSPDTAGSLFGTECLRGVCSAFAVSSLAELGSGGGGACGAGSLRSVGIPRGVTAEANRCCTIPPFTAAAAGGG